MESVDFNNLNLDFLLNNNNKEFCIIKNNYDFYFKLNFKNDTNKILIFSNGAANRKKSELPIFMRHTWSDEINANCLYLDDRTIHDSKLTIGWGIGREDTHFLNEVSLIIKKITNVLTINAEDTFYYGSSAGGFMSLVLSIKHRNTKAIVNNPQLILQNYIEGKPLSFIRNNFFKGFSQQEFIEKYQDRISIPYIMNQENYVPKMLYLLNRASLEDYNQQYLPFLERIKHYNIDSTNIEYLIYQHESYGHNPLPKDRTVKIINSALENNFH